MLSHVWFFATPWNCSLPGSSFHGILQARILEWVAMPSSRGPFWSRDRTRLPCVSCVARRILYHWGSCQNWDRSLKLPYKMWKCYSFSRVWLFFDPIDCSLPGSSVHGIFQARILEWVAISFSRRSSWLRIEWWSSALQADFLLSEPPGKPVNKNSLLILMVMIPLYSLCHLEPNSVFPRKKKWIEKLPG